jgi:hypothetical protein
MSEISCNAATKRPSPQPLSRAQERGVFQVEGKPRQEREDNDYVFQPPHLRHLDRRSRSVGWYSKSMEVDRMIFVSPSQGMPMVMPSPRLLLGGT